MCVETLKRDWDSKLTLRDVLVTISCLLIQPNPDSALNAEAGALIQEDFEAFKRRAELMTSIHAGVPKVLQVAVKEAQCRGQGSVELDDDCVDERSKRASQPDAPVRRRRGPTARQRGTATSRRSDGSPSGMVRRRNQAPPSQPFVVQAGNDDIFGMSQPSQQEQANSMDDDDSSMMDANQENDESRSPTKAKTPKATTPRRPLGAPVPLGELTLEEVSSDGSEDEAEAEYPPSPRKSPMKSPAKRPSRQANTLANSDRAESSRTAAQRAPNITPPNNLITRPLAENSPFFIATDQTPSPRKTRLRPQTPRSGRTPLFPALTTPQNNGGIFKTKSPSSSEKKQQEAKRKAELDAKLWDLCGRDIARWNRGDFDGEPFKMKAKRW